MADNLSDAWGWGQQISQILWITKKKYVAIYSEQSQQVVIRCFSQMEKLRHFLKIDGKLRSQHSNIVHATACPK